MRIEALTMSSSPSGTRHPGQQYDVDEAEGRALVKGGAARAVEAAVNPAPAAGQKTEAERYAETVTDPGHAKAEKRGKR